MSYINDSLGHASLLDYFFVSDSSAVLDILTLDPDINFSDHLPVKVSIRVVQSFYPITVRPDGRRTDPGVRRLRWDHVD